MASLPDPLSSLLLSLAAFLAGEGRPLSIEVVLTPSDEVLSLRARTRELEEALSTARAEYNRLEFRYRCECTINLELQDLLKQHGISYRESIQRRVSDT